MYTQQRGYSLPLSSPRGEVAPGLEGMEMCGTKGEMRRTEGPPSGAAWGGGLVVKRSFQWQLAESWKGRASRGGKAC